MKPIRAVAALPILLASTPAAVPCPGGQGNAIPGPVRDALERVMPSVVEARRTIHAHPELGERETATAALIAGRLRDLGLEVREGVAGTGVIGLLRGGRPGGCAAYRADMDALPITEETGLPFASRRRARWNGEEVGVMHACGHDMHVAAALGVAAVLADPVVRAGLAGSVLFVFQPAEEGLPEPGPHGAERMLLEGAFDDPRPSAVFGLHVDPTLALGQVAALSGGALAAVDRFDIEILGRQAHGAYPQDGIDPIVVASHVVLALQTIASRSVDTRQAVVVTVGMLQAGNRFNVIPASAHLRGTIRTHDVAVQDLVHDRMRAIATGVAESLGARAEVEIQKVTPVTVNDPDLLGRMLPVIEASVGEGNVAAEPPHMGGEDFAYFAAEVPGLYYFLGVGDPSQGTSAGVHTPAFAPQEGALEIGVRTSAMLLLAYLGSG